MTPARRLQKLLRKEFLWQLPHEQVSHEKGELVTESLTLGCGCSSYPEGLMSVAHLLLLQESHHEKIGPFVYFTRRTAEQPMTCLLGEPVGGHGEQVILDLNQLSLVVGAEVAVGQVNQLGSSWGSICICSCMSTA